MSLSSAGVKKITLYASFKNAKYIIKYTFIFKLHLITKNMDQTLCDESIQASLNQVYEKNLELMSEHYGRAELSWIKCLFGDINDMFNLGQGVHNQIQKGYEEVHEYIGIFESEKLPTNFQIQIVGLQYNRKNIQLRCETPELHPRDYQEIKVLDEIENEMQELMIGKHDCVKLNLNHMEETELDPYPCTIILNKSFGMPVEPSFTFREDLKDIIIFAQTYNNFFTYQKQRDSEFKQTAKGLVHVVKGY